MGVIGRFRDRCVARFLNRHGSLPHKYQDIEPRSDRGFWRSKLDRIYRAIDGCNFVAGDHMICAVPAELISTIAFAILHIHNSLVRSCMQGWSKARESRLQIAIPSEWSQAHESPLGVLLEDPSQVMLAAESAIAFSITICQSLIWHGSKWLRDRRYHLALAYRGLPESHNSQDWWQ